MLEKKQSHYNKGWELKATTTGGIELKATIELITCDASGFVWSNNFFLAQAAIVYRWKCQDNRQGAATEEQESSQMFLIHILVEF